MNSVYYETHADLANKICYISTEGESFASIWAGYEFEAEHSGRISIDLPPDYKGPMASPLEHHRHELHFVDELKEKYAKKCKQR